MMFFFCDIIFYFPNITKLYDLFLLILTQTPLSAIPFLRGKLPTPPVSAHFPGISAVALAESTSSAPKSPLIKTTLIQQKG
jgi:hypothetical protein